MRPDQAVFYLYWVGALGSAVIVISGAPGSLLLPWNILISYLILKLLRHGR